MMKEQITFEYIDIKIPEFKPEFFCIWILEVIEKHNKECGDLTFIFCTDDYLLDMNRTHLNHDYYTDIITFNYNEGNSLSGDLFISWERVVDNAAEHNVKNLEELARVMIHGVLHLVGFNDKTEPEQTEMTKQENLALKLRNSFT